jgi:hypothetical protein
VYLNGGEHVLETFAFDAGTGARKWQRTVGDQSGSTTPTIDGDLVFSAMSTDTRALRQIPGCRGHLADGAQHGWGADIRGLGGSHRQWQRAGAIGQRFPFSTVRRTEL